MLLDLISNLALLVALVVGLQALRQRLDEKRRWAWRLSAGVLFGLVGLADMMTPMHFAPGVIYDGRSVVLSLAGLFGGAVPASIAVAMCGAYRWSLGGAGVWAGLGVIVESAALGVALQWLRRRDERWMRWWRLLLFGLVVHALMLGLQFLIPGGIGLMVARRFGVAILALYPLAFLLAAHMFLEGERQRENLRALSRSEMRYRSLFENNHAAMLLIAPEDGRIVDANPAACAFYGWPRKELRGKAITEINLLDADAIRREMACAVGHTRNFFEFRHRLADGSLRDVEVFSGPIELDGASLLYSVVHDVSAKRRAEEALRESRLDLERAEVLAQVGSWRIDLRSRRLTVSDEARRICGAIEPELSLDAYRSALLEPYRECLDGALMGLVQSDAPCDVEYEIRRASDGAVRFIHSMAQYDRERRIVVGAMQDVTDRKRAEQTTHLFSHIVEESLNEIYLISADTLMLWQVNGAAQRNLGYSIEELRAMTLFDIAPDITRERFDALARPLLTGEKQGVVVETVHARRDGSRYPVEAHLQVLEHAAQKLFVAMVLDTSDREASEKARRSLEEQLAHSQRMEAVGQLAGGVAHDFNNILQAIHGYTEMAHEMARPGSDQRRNLDDVLKAAERAETLVKQLLAFSRRQVLEMRDVNLNEVITDMLKMLRRVIGEHIQLDVIPGRNLGTVRADPGQIGQILTNLCVNARDAMPEGGTISVETENVRIDHEYCEHHPWAKPGRYVLLSVTDTGCGMDSETQANIFQPFFTTKEPGKGTGLGLATVYGLVKQHNGFIHVYSEVGRGSAFKIYLPVVERLAVTVGNKIVGAVPGGSETILLAEDEPTVRNLTRTFLEQAGYRVLATRDGEEALAVFRRYSGEIALSILDVIMPKMGGRIVYERIRSTHPDARVLFASGYSMNAVHTNFVLDEGLSLIQKPYRRDDLLRAVRKVLERVPE